MVKRQMKVKGLEPEEAVFVAVDVNKIHGLPGAEAVMPGHNWQVTPREEYGIFPFAKGFVPRKGVEKFLTTLDEKAAAQLAMIKGEARVTITDKVEVATA